MVLGLTAVISPITITDEGAFRDLAAAVAVTMLLIPFVLKGKITRIEGALLVLGYIGYMFGPMVF